MDYSVRRRWKYGDLHFFHTTISATASEMFCSSLHSLIKLHMYHRSFGCVMLMFCTSWWAQEERVGLERRHPGTFCAHEGEGCLWLLSRIRPFILTFAIPIMLDSTFTCFKTESNIHSHTFRWNEYFPQWPCIHFCSTLCHCLAFGFLFYCVGYILICQISVSFCHCLFSRSSCVCACVNQPLCISIGVFPLRLLCPSVSVSSCVSRARSPVLVFSWFVSRGFSFVLSFFHFSFEFSFDFPLPACCRLLFGFLNFSCQH